MLMACIRINIVINIPKIIIMPLQKPSRGIIFSKIIRVIKKGVLTKARDTDSEQKGIKTISAIQINNIIITIGGTKYNDINSNTMI